MDLKDLTHSIDINTNSILISYYNSRYDKEIYEVYTENYTASCSLFESIKSKIEPIKTLVFLKILTSGFTDEEITILTASLNVIDNNTAKVQKSLDYYDAVLKAYKSKR